MDDSINFEEFHKIIKIRNHVNRNVAKKIYKQSRKTVYREIRSPLFADEIYILWAVHDKIPYKKFDKEGEKLYNSDNYLFYVEEYTLEDNEIFDSYIHWTPRHSRQMSGKIFVLKDVQAKKKFRKLRNRRTELDKKIQKMEDKITSCNQNKIKIETLMNRLEEFTKPGYEHTLEDIEKFE